MKKTTREWVKKAEDDYQHAARTHVGDCPFHDQVCFHCQQSAEKYLKALLEERTLSIPKTHDLVRLLGLLIAAHPPLGRFRVSLKTLTHYAIESRYPGDNATKRQAVAALKSAGKVRVVCRSLLGLK